MSSSPVGLRKCVVCELVKDPQELKKALVARIRIILSALASVKPATGSVTRRIAVLVERFQKPHQTLHLHT